jgi:transposase InsO family protein
MIPRPMGETLRVFERNQALHADYLFLGESTEEWGEFRWVMVLMDRFTHFIMLIPCKEPSAEVTAQGILHWYSMFGIVKLIITDQGSHFKNSLMRWLTHLLGVGQKFTSPYASWSNGVIERMNKEVIRVFKALPSEHGLSTDKWPSSKRTGSESSAVQQSFRREWKEEYHWMRCYRVKEVD